MKKVVLIAGKKDENELIYRNINSVNDAQVIFLSLGKIFENIFTIKILKTLSDKNIINRLCSQYISLGYKKSIFDKVQFASNDEIYFIVMARIYEKYGNSILKFLCRKFKNCHLYCYMTDIASSFMVSIETLRRNFERVYTFDFKEAEKYSLFVCQEPFEYIEVEADEMIEQCDVTFVGKAKDRLDYLLRIYEALKSAGLKCKFFIYGVDEKDQKYSSEIVYNYYMPFSEVLQRVCASKTVLEVMQGDGYSPTTRYQEAMIYGKNLLTDCKGFDGVHYVAENNIQIIDRIDTIDFTFLVEEHTFDKDKYKQFFSLANFIDTFRIEDE